MDFAKAKFTGKQATRVTRDIAIISKDWIKRKIITNNRYFNYEKIGHFEKNYKASMTYKKNQSNNPR